MAKLVRDNRWIGAKLLVLVLQNSDKQSYFVAHKSVNGVPMDVLINM